MPNAVTMMGEFCPDKRRATVINLMFCGFPLGAAFGSFLAAWMIPHFGWRSVADPRRRDALLLGVLLLLKMPESVRFGRQQPRRRQVRATLALISRDALNAGSFALTERAADRQQGHSASCCRARTSSAR